MPVDVVGNSSTTTILSGSMVLGRCDPALSRSPGTVTSAAALHERRDPESAIDLHGNTDGPRNAVHRAHHPADLSQGDADAASLDHVIGATQVDVPALLVSTGKVPRPVHELPRNEVVAQHRAPKVTCHPSSPS